jgi:energy-converting hydrogenase B subunit Q
MSPRRRGERTAPPTVAIRVEHEDRPELIPAIAARVAEAGGTVRTLSTVRWIAEESVGEQGAQGHVESELEVESVAADDLLAAIGGVPGVLGVRPTRALDKVFGKRVIVVGGGAQVAQVALGAVSEADRHNLRGELISVDTIPLVSEEKIAAAVRAVADLPRARLLVLAGSIMGGDISRAADELRARGIPVIALNMAGSITDHVDLVVTDPVQAGTMAVMAIADTATFDLARQRGRRY